MKVSTNSSPDSIGYALPKFRYFIKFHSVLKTAHLVSLQNQFLNLVPDILALIFFVFIGSSKRVQMRIYRGPDNDHNTQWGFFIRQPSFD